jgi:hypothetical protein
MCGGCGTPPPSANWYEAGVENSSRGRAQALQRLADAAGWLLKTTGVKIHAQPASRSLMMRAPTGRTILIRQFGEITPAAQALGSPRINPLVGMGEVPGNSRTETCG